MESLSLLSLALAPGLSIALYLYFKDKHEKEPLSLLVKGFFLGCFSIVMVLAISYPLSWIVHYDGANVFDQGINAFLNVALVEEGCKFLLVRFVLFRDKHFNEPFDGIVYTGMVGMGFATLENIFYVFEHGMETGILRMFTAVPAHATFAILMGYYLGKAKFSPHHKGLLSLTALFVATLFHGSYDFFLFIAFIPGIWGGAFVSLAVALYFSRKAIRLHQQASPFQGIAKNNV